MGAPAPHFRLTLTFPAPRAAEARAGPRRRAPGPAFQARSPRLFVDIRYVVGGGFSRDALPRFVSKSIAPEGAPTKSAIRGAGFDGGYRVSASLLEAASAAMLFPQPRRKASGLKASPTKSAIVRRGLRSPVSRCRFVVGSGFSRDALLAPCRKASRLKALLRRARKAARVSITGTALPLRCWKRL